MLDLNFSIFAISILIFILWKILTPVFFRPIGRIIHEREEKITHDSQQLQGLITRIQEQTAHVEQQVHQAQKESQKIKEELIQKGETIRRDLVESARTDANRLFSEKMAELDSQIARAEKDLEKEVVLFSQKLKESILA